MLPEDFIESLYLLCSPFFRYSEYPENFQIVPIFYYFLMMICACGQIAIFLKKHIERSNDPIQAKNVNNQRWNDYICNNVSLITRIVLIFAIGMGARFVVLHIFNELSLSEELHEQFKIQSVQLIQSVIIPLFMYITNDKLFKHVKSEIMA